MVAKTEHPTICGAVALAGYLEKQGDLQWLTGKAVVGQYQQPCHGASQLSGNFAGKNILKPKYNNILKKYNKM